MAQNAHGTSQGSGNRATNPTFTGSTPTTTYMHPVPLKAEAELLKLPLQTALRRNILFPEVDTTCLFRDIYQYNASNKIKAIHRKLFQRDSVTSFSFLKSKREEKKKQMQIATHRILC